jgi:hypothetical protein
VHPWAVDRPSEPGRHRRPPVPGVGALRTGSTPRAPDDTLAGDTLADETAADEASANGARRRLREQGIVPIEPDERIGVMLAPEERVVAVRRDVVLERRKDWRDPEDGLGGDLYVTTRRLVHLGRVLVHYQLAEIREAEVAAGAIRLVVGDCHGVEIRVHDPRVLRVEIAAVREAASTSVAGAASPAGADEGHAAASPDATLTSTDGQAPSR